MSPISCNPVYCLRRLVASRFVIVHRPRATVCRPPHSSPAAAGRHSCHFCLPWRFLPAQRARGHSSSTALRWQSTPPASTARRAPFACNNGSPFWIPPRPGPAHAHSWRPSTNSGTGTSAKARTRRYGSRKTIGRLRWKRSQKAWPIAKIS